MKAVVLLSGGVDSTLCLALTLRQNVEVHALTVDYGQQHVREVRAACEIADYYKVNHTVTTVDRSLFSGSSLTCGDADSIPSNHADAPDSTYVPARNTVLIALAAARAESIGATRIVIGANADDEAAYPDCRRKYIETFRDVLQLGTLNHVWLMAPLLSMSKQDVVQECRALDVPLHLTWSCYRGWDEPCGHCGACEMLTQVRR